MLWSQVLPPPALTMEGSRVSAWEWGSLSSANPPVLFTDQVYIPNRCHAGGTRLAPGEPLGEAEISEGTKTRDLEQVKKDPNSCFFEGQHRAHGTRWAPEYDKKCSICSCQVQARVGGMLEGGKHPSGVPPCNKLHTYCPQKRTVICDPILCQPLNCTRQVHPEELCCPICEGTWRLRGPQAGVWGSRGVPHGNKVGESLSEPLLLALCACPHNLPLPCREKDGAGGAEAGAGTGQ